MHRLTRIGSGLLVLGGLLVLPTGALAGPPKTTTTTTTLKPSTTTTCPPSTTTTTEKPKPTSTTTTKPSTTTTKPSTTTTTEKSTTTTTTSTTTTTKPTTTTTEPTTTTSASTTTLASTTTTVTVPSTTTTTLPEQCGNCQDDDGDGLIDFEDDDCCAEKAPAPLLVRRAMLRSRRGATGLFMRGCIGIAPQDLVDPLSQDVHFQLYRADGERVCGKIPSLKFMAMRRGKAIAFWDNKGRVPSAQGVQDMSFMYRDGCLGFYAQGRRVRLESQKGDALWLVLGLADPNDPSRTVCVRTASAMRTR